MKNYLKAYRNIFNYKGEVGFDEFWTVFAIDILVTVLVTITLAFWRKFDPSATSLANGVLNVYRGLSLLVMFSLGFKRLRNAGISGFLFFVPILNIILATFPKKKIAV